MQIWRTIAGRPVLITVPAAYDSVANLSACNSISPPKISSQFLADDEDACWNTRCKYCGDSIWYIRHNGGSVFVEKLGVPWPKHDCYYASGANSSRCYYLVLSSLRDISNFGPESCVAVVRKVVLSGHETSGFSMLAIDFLRGPRACISVIGNHKHLVGQFVSAELGKKTGSLRSDDGKILGVFDTTTDPGRLGLPRSWVKRKKDA